MIHQISALDVAIGHGFAVVDPLAFAAAAAGPALQQRSGATSTWATLPTRKNDVNVNASCLVMPGLEVLSPNRSCHSARNVQVISCHNRL